MQEVETGELNRRAN